MDALTERTGHGRSGRTDGVWVDVVMVGTWMLRQNGWGLGGRYHAWDMDALAERMGSGWTLSNMDALSHEEDQEEHLGAGTCPGRSLVLHRAILPLLWFCADCCCTPVKNVLAVGPDRHDEVLRPGLRPVCGQGSQPKVAADGPLCPNTCRPGCTT